MMKIWATVLLVLLSIFIEVSSADSHTRIHESHASTPTGFVFLEPAPPGHTVDLRIGLVQGNITGLEKSLFDVSDVSSPSYGRHLSKGDVENFVRPSTETTDKVLSWLSKNNVSVHSTTDAGDWLSISLPIHQADALLSTDFNVFIHKASGKQTIRTLSYSLPADLQNHIALVHPTVNFPDFSHTGPTITSPLKPTSNVVPTVASNCSTSINPICLESLYDIPTTIVNQSSMAVAGFINQYPNRGDLQNFLSQFRPDLVNTTYILQTIDDGQDPQNATDAGVEANLDIQYSVGISSGIPTTFISVGPDYQDGQLDGFLDIINYLLSESSPPGVLSISYGQNEDDLTYPLAQQLCNAYMQLGARGTSILFASGDGGVSGFQTNPNCTTFVPTFPSTCPYVTSVGASQFIPETAASFSSGGFSNYFSIPSYQSATIIAYATSLAASNSSVAGLYNASGRAYPDISAMGQDVEIVVGGDTGLVAGTSCSTPIFAGVIALLNDRLASAGRPPMGFLNPFLYSVNASKAMNDITSGSNPGCNTSGFEANVGWDPVTGLGTPNFQNLLTALGIS